MEEGYDYVASGATVSPSDDRLSKVEPQAV